MVADTPAATRAVVLTLVGPRQFRYLLGDQLLEAGRNLREIARVLGHREGNW